MSTNQNLYINTLAGTLLACIGNSDVQKSILLAAVGATVSFSVSLLLRFLSKKIKEWLLKRRYK